MQKQTSEREMTEEEEVPATEGWVCRGEWCWVGYQEGLSQTEECRRREAADWPSQRDDQKWTSSQLCRQLHSIESDQHLSTAPTRERSESHHVIKHADFPGLILQLLSRGPTEEWPQLQKVLHLS